MIPALLIFNKINFYFYQTPQTQKLSIVSLNLCLDFDSDISVSLGEMIMDWLSFVGVAPISNSGVGCGLDDNGNGAFGAFSLWHMKHPLRLSTPFFLPAE